MIIFKKIKTFLNLLSHKKFNEIIYLFLINIGVSKTSDFCLFLKYKLNKQPTNYIYFMHINKTGGTSLRESFTQINENSITKIIHIPHSVKPKHLNFENNNRYMLNIRDPLQRLNSAFYDRKRQKGLTNPNEIKYFTRFPEINNLGESLSSKDFNQKKEALDALKRIVTVNTRLTDWFNIKFLENNKPFFIFELENINIDYLNFCRKISLNKDIPLKKVNQNIALKKQDLSELSIINFRNYLKNYYLIYEYLLKNKKNINDNFN